MSLRGRAGEPAASVRGRLRELARREGVEFQLLLAEFAVERLLFRLGVSPHADEYVLKGAMLFRLWSPERGRATWDLDLLGRGASGVAGVVAVVRRLCAIPAKDGIEFDAESIVGEEIRAADEYDGVRIRLVARLAGARIPVQLDVGFGDAVEPPPERAHYPVLLDHEPPRVLVYPREVVVAEKLEAIVSLGVTNSRMKDFYDLYQLSNRFDFSGETLATSIRATFQRRKTPVPADEPIPLAPGFLAAPERRVQWQAFLRRGRLVAVPEPEEIGRKLNAFAWPPLVSIATGVPFDRFWTAGGVWS